MLIVEYINCKVMWDCSQLKSKLHSQYCRYKLYRTAEILCSYVTLR